MLKKTTTMLIYGIPLLTKAEFKATCAARGETMQDTIVKLMRQAVSRHKKEIKKIKKAEKAVANG